MAMPSPRASLDRMLSRSVLGTALVLVGGVVLLAGLLYGGALGLTELLAPPRSGPTPASNGGVLGPVVVLLFGSAFVAVGGQLIGYAR